MTYKIFNSQWESMDVACKKKHVTDSLLGLEPVIVYLDDEEDALEVFKGRCKELGVEAFTSTDQGTLIEFINRNKSRILFIISDYKLPGYTGFNFRSKVLEMAPELPFMILSGYVDREMALEGIKHKISAFIEKPLKKQNLISLLISEGDKRAETIREEYEMMKGFTDDVTTIMEEVEEACLKLENDLNDHDTIARVFGLVHTIKGASGFFEPRTLHVFAHAFEDQLKQIQNGSCQLTSKIISTWLKASDVIKTLNREFITGQHHEHDIDSLKSMFALVAEQRIEQPVKGDERPSSNEKQQRQNDLRVSMQLLDEFTQTSGELTVIRNMINKVVRSIEKEHKGDKDVQALSELLDEMHKINSEVQNKISDIRRVGVSSLIKPLTRNIRDTSKALGKDIELVIEGSDLRVDNSIAEVLNRCLVHLMRNSLDHGIETSEVREESGKSPKGKLQLKFESKNEAVFVTIKDDGQGIDAEKIRQKVVSQGLRTKAEADDLSPAELHYMIFEAGFSTAKEITEFSGRGVGMSMVKDSIESAGGKITISSEYGTGSEFVLEIPVPKSVHITSSLFISVNDMTFGIPQENIVKVLDKSIQTDVHFEKLEGGDFLRFENNLIPVLSLKNILSLEENESGNMIIILESEGKSFALRIDDVYDIEDAVIKRLGPTCLQGLKLYQGGTFLGDGTVGLIFNIAGLVELLNLSRIKKETPVSPQSLTLENIMVFELQSKGLYALREKDIFRVEFIDHKQVQTSGNYSLMPYRDSMLTVIDPQEILFGQKNLSGTSSSAALITKNGNTYVGLIVKNVLDLVPVEMKLIPHLKKIKGLSGNILHGERTFTLISHEELIELLEEDKPMNEDENFTLAA